ncbi:hypothetical protein LFYK43_03590 [Ligilactobacillus salitolerans]|uniref:FecR protein domain-containing protein n=1 Tax=Ligilactobacillus salitolerans TaxID=1808352 RepID=A0A401IQU6_9LACO|nr:hypothetical protein [Ligilactobacillus salitolerans]GBG93900.1 hypothetical protein LFYK43_03590 [Ligilactobacillus salitolerans]
MVTYVSGNEVKSLDHTGNISDITAGTLLGLNHEIQTNNGRIAIRSSRSTIYRVGPQSSFSVQQAIAGEVAIFYGKVYTDSLRSKEIVDGAKYRTSCYLPGPVTGLITNIDAETDRYYSFSDPLEIMEYDEQGERFQIARVEPFSKLELSFDDSLKMRERYKIVATLKLDDAEIASLYSDWVSPIKWK